MAKMVCRNNPQHVYESDDDYSTCPMCPAFSEAQGMKRELPDEPPTHRTPAPQPEKTGRTTVIWNYKNAADPVVGWLVATKGPAKGKDYAVRSGNNSIGRSPNSRIYIPEDSQIHSTHAIITYDPKVLRSEEHTSEL